MKVLQIVIAPPLRKDTALLSTTGPERRAANLASKWKDADVDVMVCYPNRGNMRAAFESAGLFMVDFEIGSKFNIFAISSLSKIVKQNQIELIHSQGPPSLDLIATLAARQCDIPIVVTRPSMIEDQLTYAAMRRWIYDFVDRIVTLPRVSCVVAVSRNGLERLRRSSRLAEDRLCLIYNGIDLDRFRDCESGQSDEKTEQTIVVGMIGQLFASKYWEDFIEVIYRLKNRGVKIKGLIVGEGELRNILETQVASLGLENEVSFTGFEHDVRDSLSRMDIFLFTTRREGLSVAILEAMAAGTPIVATRVGGIEEQIENKESGFIVEPGDIDAMVDRCEQLANSPKLRSTFAAAARKKVNLMFDQDRMFDSYIRVYRKALSSKHKTRGLESRVEEST